MKAADFGPGFSKVACGAMCKVRNKNWPLAQCNAFVWGGPAASSTCDIGSFDLGYVPRPVDTEMDADKELYVLEDGTYTVYNK